MPFFFNSAVFIFYPLELPSNIKFSLLKDQEDSYNSMNFHRNNKIIISLFFFFDNNLIYQKILLSDIRFIRIETLNEKKNSQKETEDIVDETQAKNVGN